MRRVALVAFLAGALGGPSCGVTEDASDASACAPDADLVDGNLTLTGDPCVLAPRVAATRAPLTVRDGLGGRVRLDFALTEVASVASPLVDGTPLQATAVAHRGTVTLVSYNVAGDRAAGGLDVFRLLPWTEPELRSQALFHDLDVSSVAVGEGVVYAAAAGGEGVSGGSARLERLALHGERLARVTEGPDRVGLASFAATGVAVAGDSLLVTSGSDGGLTVLDRHSLAVTAEVPLADARWVAARGDLALVAQGTPGRLSVLELRRGAAPELLRTLDFDGAEIPESKTTVEVVGDYAFVAAGAAGVQVLSISTGNVVGTIPAPLLEGVDPSETVTNAVSVDHDLVFVANGAAGVSVVLNDKHFSDLSPGAPLHLRVLGTLRFGDAVSANAVSFHQGHLVVAAGRGGLRLVELDLEGHCEGH